MFSGFSTLLSKIKKQGEQNENSEFNYRNRIYGFVRHRDCDLSDSAWRDERRQRSGINDGGDSVSRTVFCVALGNNRFGGIRDKSSEKCRTIAGTIN